MGTETSAVVGTVLTRTDVTQQDIEYIVGAGLMACGYWMDDISHSSVEIARGATAIVIVEDDDKSYTLTRGDVIEGIKLYSEHVGKSPRELLDNHDGVDGDCVIQFAIFKEIVFG